MFCIALSIILLIIDGLTRIMKEEEEDRAYIRPVARLLLFVSAAILVIPLLGQRLNTLSFLMLIALLLFIPVFIGIKSWVKYRFFSHKNDTAS